MAERNDAAPDRKTRFAPDGKKHGLCFMLGRPLWPRRMSGPATRADPTKELFPRNRESRAESPIPRTGLRDFVTENCIHCLVWL